MLASLSNKRGRTSDPKRVVAVRIAILLGLIIQMRPYWDEAGYGQFKCIAGWPRCCRWLNHMKVRHYLGCFHMCIWACGGGRGGADFAVLDSVCGGRRFINLMAEGRSLGGATRGGKRAAKVLHFPKK